MIAGGSFGTPLEVHPDPSSSVWIPMTWFGARVNTSSLRLAPSQFLAPNPGPAESCWYYIYIYMYVLYITLYNIVFYIKICLYAFYRRKLSNFRQYGQMEKQRWEESENRIREEKESEGRRCRCARNTMFPVICVSRESKSRLSKAAGAEPCGQIRDEKLHAVVARSTFPSQSAQLTPGSDHFWQLRCRKSARHCGAKHISKSKCTKHTILRPLLDIEMSKKCTPLWREAHFQVKMYKAQHSRTAFGSWHVEKVHAVVARSTCVSQNAQSTPCSDHFWKLRCQKRARRCGVKHISKSKV